MTLKARLTDGSIISLAIDPTSASVGELRIVVSESIPQSNDNIRMVYKGNIMNRDDDKLSKFSMSNDDIIHIAQPQKKSTPTKQATTESREFDDGMSSILDNPMIQSMMSNPAFMQSIIAQDPRIKKMAEDNPELRQALEDPEMMQDLSRATRNPKLMQEIMKNQDRALSNIESIPGGFNHLSSMMKNMTSAGELDDPCTEAGDKKMAKKLGITTSPTSSQPNSSALPNPWAPKLNYQKNSSMPPQNLNQAFQNRFVQNAQTSQIEASVRGIEVNMSAETRYRIQLDVLKDMGFSNEEQNKRALMAAGGNTEAAIAFILDE